MERQSLVLYYGQTDAQPAPDRRWQTLSLLGMMLVVWSIRSPAQLYPLTRSCYSLEGQSETQRWL